MYANMKMNVLGLILSLHGHRGQNQWCEQKGGNGHTLTHTKWCQCDFIQHRGEKRSQATQTQLYLHREPENIYLTVKVTKTTIKVNRFASRKKFSLNKIQPRGKKHQNTWATWNTKKKLVTSCRQGIGHIHKYELNLDWNKGGLHIINSTHYCLQFSPFIKLKGKSYTKGCQKCCDEGTSEHGSDSSKSSSTDGDKKQQQKSTCLNFKVRTFIKPAFYIPH